ncbi:MAG: redox-sensing transcriptional repressor Rex [Firmicutes bacterium]|nr:redox-sensing transcriptional repressor Rex [Bacillota bacterium]
MRWSKISDAVIRRLPLYLRVLEEVGRDPDVKLISSQELGDQAGVSPALVRKDLGWFGEFGKQGVGYEIAYLASELRRILNLDKEIPVALVGVGSLGSALVRYAGQRYEEEASFNLHIVALFDSSPNKIGGNVDGIPIWPMEALKEQVAEKGIKIAIVTVPSSSAQMVADQLVAAGVKAILNFAPVQLTVPEGVHVANADVSLELQRLAYYLST